MTYLPLCGQETVVESAAVKMMRTTSLKMSVNTQAGQPQHNANTSTHRLAYPVHPMDQLVRYIYVVRLLCHVRVDRRFSVYSKATKY